MRAKSSRRGALADRSLQPKHGLDQLFPRRIAKPGLGGKHRQFAGLPAIAARGLGLGGPARLAARYAQFKPAAQAGLVILDLGQQVIARGDHALERFFWACSASSVNTQPFRPRASISSGAAGISLLFSATIRWPSTI